jgi:aminoglycoside phosphotransferase family enzyme/predicted kinase
MATADDLIAALSCPDAYPGHPGAVVVRETHISYVFLAGELAYKLKKPLVLPFLDYGTPARRREMCCAEIRLNRRLAPEVYLGVRGVRLDDEGRAVLLDEDDQTAIDYLVEMRRYDERATLAAQVERGDADAAQIAAVAQVIARFHERVPALPVDGRAAISAERRFEQNAHELLGSLERHEQLGRILALERFAHAYVGAHRAEFERRSRQGRVRDGHGDLRAEHVVLDPAVQIVDCVEFDRSLRALDTADDLAFLVLDLTALGRPDLGAALVEAYRAAGGDAGDDPLLSFYAAYRALVRAKVALVRASQSDREEPEALGDEDEARRLIELAESFAWRARLPLVVAVCGVPASGKSQLAGALARASGLPWLRSDAVRKQLVSVGPGERAPGEAYRAEISQRTYAALGMAAAAALEHGGGVIVDATFRRREDRHAFGAELGAAAPAVFVECRAPFAVLAQRARRRDAGSDRMSDADLPVVLAQSSSWEPLDEITGVNHVMLRSDRSVAELLSELTASLDERLVSLR